MDYQRFIYARRRELILTFLHCLFFIALTTFSLICCIKLDFILGVPVDIALYIAIGNKLREEICTNYYLKFVKARGVKIANDCAAGRHEWVGCRCRYCIANRHEWAFYTLFEGEYVKMHGVTKRPDSPTSAKIIRKCEKCGITEDEVAKQVVWGKRR